MINCCNEHEYLLHSVRRGFISGARSLVEINLQLMRAYHCTVMSCAR